MVVLVAGVEPVFVLKVSARGVRKQVCEVIVRVVIVRRAVVLVLEVGARYHPLGGVWAMGGECIGDLLGEQKVREFVGVATSHRSQIIVRTIRIVVDVTTACRDHQEWRGRRGGGGGIVVRG